RRFRSGARAGVLPGDQLVNGPRTRAAEHEGCQRGEIQQVDLVAGRPELWARVGDGQKLDRVESVRPVHMDRCNEQNRCKWNADHGDPRSNENRQAAHELESDRRPGHPMWRRNAEAVKRRGEVCWAPLDLRVAVGNEPATNNQSQWNGRPPSRPLEKSGSGQSVDSCVHGLLAWLQAAVHDDELRDVLDTL